MLAIESSIPTAENATELVDFKREHRQSLAMSGTLAAAVAAVIAAAFGVLLWFADSYESEIGTRVRGDEMRLVNGELSTAFDRGGRFALALAEVTARRTTIRQALAARDRAELMHQSADIFAHLRQQAGVQIFGFQDKDIRYFLRVHKPDQFDDDISGFRPMIVAANRAGRPQVGLEIGVAGIGLRGATIVEHEGAMVGTVEVGLDLKPLIESVKTTSNADIAIVVVPSLAGIALDPKLPAFGDLVLAMSTDDRLFSSLLKTMSLRPAHDSTAASPTIDGRRYDLITRPVVDFSGRMIGFSIALKPDYGTELRRSRTELRVVAICGGICAFVAFALLFRATRARGRACP
ncbi:cache domain-containing protein [Bradyrhizobium neotropicale]|uniref:Double Cache domain-containing protein n=1 Tax=Bradyrhizobium neotropicale TaxID=1497615 RepID=A0A176Z0F1_9BRAD|nr:cache domain-containing protein [Bradyrhizobium neotropicale]OAF13712.1 hypothetical protein AXW67_18435 [Bradyrhizobium neotropicale]